MNIAALIAWIVTAGGGFYLLAAWIRHGGARTPGASRFPPALILGHAALAAAGLVVWLAFLAAGAAALAWIAFGLLVPIAALGFTMFFRWIPAYRDRPAVRPAGPGDAGRGRPGPGRAALPRGRRRPARPARRDHGLPGPAGRPGRQLRLTRERGVRRCRGRPVPGGDGPVRGPALTGPRRTGSEAWGSGVAAAQQPGGAGPARRRCRGRTGRTRSTAASEPAVRGARR